MAGSDQCSIVEYFAEHEGYRCGYCKSPNTNFSHGMWAHSMTVEDYQDLIDRGWRRSGKYCYKPTMNVTCCPQYTIRCDAEKVKITKSQKNVIKKLNKYLLHGKTKGPEETNNNPEPLLDDSIVDVVQQRAGEVAKKACPEMPIVIKSNPICSNLQNGPLPSSVDVSNKRTVSARLLNPSTSTSDLPDISNKKIPKAGDGPDKTKPPSKKAKQLRLQRRAEKLKQKLHHGIDYEKLEKRNKNSEKSLDDFLAEVDVADSANKLEIKLVRVASSSLEFVESIEESFLLYQKYQMIIHNETESECNKDCYFNFLVKSPLEKFCSPNGPLCGYGSFHHQYRLNGKLIAVGVLDILPRCVSSVYFYYDPDYSFLSLGTYASLRELALTRELQSQCPELQFYYLGFYIHSCPKMRYKGQYRPSYLLCPEAYTWQSIETCVPKLDLNKYSRLENDERIQDEDLMGKIGDVQVLYRHEARPYSLYLILKSGRAHDEAEVRQYSKLVGFKCARRMLLYRS